MEVKYMNITKQIRKNSEMSTGQITAKHLTGIKYDCLKRDEEKDLILLTDRKQDYLQLLAIGLSNDEIADILSVSVSTVKSTLEELFRELNAINRTDAVSIAILHKLFPQDYRSNIVQKYPKAACIYKQKLLNRDNG